VRRNAVRIAEPLLARDGPALLAVLRAADDPDVRVRMQAAYSLGESHDPRVGPALGRLIVRDAREGYVVKAVVSSCIPSVDQVLAAAIEAGLDNATLDALLNTAVGSGNEAAIGLWWKQITAEQGPGRLRALVWLLEAAEQQGKSALVHTSDRAPVIAAILDDARRKAADAQAQDTERAWSIALLGRDPGRRSQDLRLLGELLSARESLETQTAAVQRLAKIKEKSAAAMLMDRWGAVSPQVRAQILDTMLSRSGWVHDLLDRMAGNAEMVAALGTARREQLLRSRTPGVAERATKLLGGSGNADRQKLAAEYVRLMGPLQPDPERGKALFTSHCAVCHKVGDHGREIGPDLLALADKPVDQLALAIFDPNSAVEGRFVNYIATMSDGSAAMGLIKFESGNSITLVGLNGHDQVIARGSIQSLVSTGRSLMPEGFENALKPQDTADLLEYLRREARRGTAAQN
jgi:putative heme-binding domain-containing protein